MGILELPSGSVLLDWPPADYTSPTTRGWTPAALCLMLAVGTLLVFGARIAARLHSRSFGVDDWIMALAMLPALGLVVNMYLALRVYHFDRHLWDINSDWAAMLKITFADEFLYIVTAGLIKISILGYFLRVTYTWSNSAVYRYAVWACMAFVICHIVAFIGESFFNCMPFNSSFQINMVGSVDSAYKAHTCANTRLVADIRNVFSLVQDFAIMLLGSLLLWNSKATRLQAATVVILGLCVCLIGLVRLGYFWIVYTQNSDWSWYGGVAFMWSAVECLVGMIAGSLPTLTVSREEWKNAPMNGSTSSRAVSVGDILRKFSMNESGRSKKGGPRVETKEMGSTDSLVSGANRNKNVYGGRRRSRLASIAQLHEDDHDN